MHRPKILLIANDRDFTTDLVVSELRKRSVDYLRLNIEDLSRDQVAFDPFEPLLTVTSGSNAFQLTADCLHSIYYRGPVWLRNYSPTDIEPERLLRRTQGWAFLRSLMAFENVHWINHPTATYQAEHKPIQLNLAKRLGFQTPKTIITNDAREAIARITSKSLAVKSLDTFLFVAGQEEGFVFTQIEEAQALQGYDFSSAPVIFQEVLEPKIDLRVTVVGQEVHSVAILRDGVGIEGDWRKQKEGLRFDRTHLSQLTSERCVRLVKELNLTFGAIDLARVGDTDFFLEVNPTGEWAWLADSADLPIAHSIVELLSRNDR